MSISDLWRAVSSRLVAEEAPFPRPAEPDVAQLVEEARRDWQVARAYFEEVSDPRLVDHAIYLLEAAEKKYMYLLSLARRSEAEGAGGRLPPVPPALDA